MATLACFMFPESSEIDALLDEALSDSPFPESIRTVETRNHAINTALCSATVDVLFALGADCVASCPKHSA